jgi:hypothetical protein
MASNPVITLVNALFTLGLLFATATQMVAYRGGLRIRERRILTWLGITAVIFFVVTGQIAGATLRNYVNFVNAQSFGQGL